MKPQFKYLYLLLIFFIASCSSYKIRNTEWANKNSATNLKNFYKINDSIYRSEQPKREAFSKIEKLGIKSILNLRADKSDSNLLHQTKLQYNQVKIVSVKFTDVEIIEALKIIKNAQKPILIHCKHGSDRTGVVVAMYRIIFQNWPKQRALEELKNGGYGFHTRYNNIPKYINNVDIAYVKNLVTAQ